MTSALPHTSSEFDLPNLELDEARMRAMGQLVLDRIVDHIGTLDTQSASGDMAGVEQLCEQLREAPPQEGAPLETLLQPFFDDWVHRSFNCASPGYLAFVPGGGVFPAALAGLIADAVNRYTGVWNAAPALVQLEANVLEWFREWMQFPKGTRGLLTSGGSMASFSAIVAARDKHLGPALREGTMYVSSQAHHCVAKAAHLAGILADRVRIVDVDEHFRMRVDRLDEAIARDRKAGLRPFLVVSAAGTTNTGAVDPLEEIANTCARERLWHHCDGAYGGFFHLAPSCRPLLLGLSRADSLALDPHKGLFLPYGTGALLVRDGEALRAAHQGHAGYLPPLPDEAHYNPSQLSPELSRPFRGLRVWLALKLFGTKRYVAALEEKRELAVYCAQQLAEMAGMKLVEQPALSLFAFRYEDSCKATEALIDGVNKRGRVMLTGCTIGETFYGRVCVLCFRTRRLHIDQCLEDIRSVSAALS